MEEELMKSPSQRIPCKKNGKYSHHPILYQGSVCVLKTLEKIFPGVFGGFVVTNIPLPEDADFCGSSQWSRLQRSEQFWGEHHNSRASLASQRAPAGLCGLLSTPSHAPPAAAGFFQIFSLHSCLPELLPRVLPSASRASQFLTQLLEPSLPSLGSTDLHGKGGKKCQSTPAESLLTIWGSKLPICSLTWRRLFVVEMAEFSPTDRKQNPSPQTFLLKPEARSGPAISPRHKTYFDRKLIFFQSFQHAPPFNQPSTPLAATWTPW